jgi:hypothetical protein
MRLGAGREGRDIGEGLAVTELPSVPVYSPWGISLDHILVGGVLLARFDIQLKGFTRPYLVKDQQR